MSLTLRPRARLDVFEQFVYFGEHANVELAERYVAAVDESCRQLVKHPNMGRLYDSGIARLHGMRRFPVNRFEKYIIFYVPQEHGFTAPEISMVFSPLKKPDREYVDPPTCISLRRAYKPLSRR